MDEKKRFTYDSQIGEKSRSAIARHLQSLITEPGKLSDYLGCSIQAVNQYKMGTTYPKVENLIKIAQFFNVSLDWLVGLSNQPSIDVESKFLTDNVKLSPAAVGKLWAYVAGRPMRMVALSALLEQDDFDYILDDVAHCLEIGSYKTALEQVLADHSIVPSEYEADLVKNDRRKDKNTTTYDATYRLGKICEHLIKESEAKEGSENNGTKE